LLKIGYWGYLEFMITLFRLILILSLVTCTFEIRTQATPQSLEDQWLHNASGYDRAFELQRQFGFNRPIAVKL
jgi:hypothetical protein